MNGEEIQSLISQLKATGLDEEQIMDVFYETFKKGDMDRADLEALANAMGYELTDEFKNEPTPDPIAAGSSEEAAEGGITKEEAEEAKAIEPGESSEEFKEKIDEMKSEEKSEESTAKEGEEKIEEKSEEKEKVEEPEKKDEEDEEKDWEEAQKLFRI